MVYTGPSSISKIFFMMVWAIARRTVQPKTKPYTLGNSAPMPLIDAAVTSYYILLECG